MVKCLRLMLYTPNWKLIEASENLELDTLRRLRQMTTGLASFTPPSWVQQRTERLHRVVRPGTAMVKGLELSPSSLSRT